jgi:hypothetical protein
VVVEEFGFGLCKFLVEVLDLSIDETSPYMNKGRFRFKNSCGAGR